MTKRSTIRQGVILATVAVNVAGFAAACKTSRGGKSTESAANGGAWVTPYNLVDINAGKQEPTKVTLVGEIERIKIDDPTEVFSAGIIEVSGMRVVIPANLIIQMPVERFTLQELLVKAPAACKARNQTGLALADDCVFERRGGQVTILANRTSSGVVVAGDVHLAKAEEFVTGVVTYIDYAQGYFRINGNPKNPEAKTTGVMIRLNDPTSRHTIQNGLGCGVGLNCSPDVRFPVDADNYTIAFVTGYPACLPSTVRTAARRSVVSFSSFTGYVGGNDGRCPFSNRPATPATTPVADSKFFAPIKVGDSLDATGNFEMVGTGANRAYFLSAHTVRIHAALRTSPGQPDYLTFAESGWDVPGFPRGRARQLWIGFSTDPDSQFDLYRISVDPNDPDPDTRHHEVPMASTVNNPGTTHLGVAPNGSNIFELHYKNLFAIGAHGRMSPCVNLNNAGLFGCANGPTLDAGENFKVMSPISREAVARTRNKTNNPNLVSYDINGNVTPNGEYLFPVGPDHPEFLEINLNRIQTPYLFTGIPWTMDRRLGPQGCGGSRGDCSKAAPLLPYPEDGGRNPMQQNIPGLNLPEAAAKRMVMGSPYTNTEDGPLLPWESIDVGNNLTISPSNPVIFSQCVNQ